MQDKPFSSSPLMIDLVRTRLNRRDTLKGLAAGGAMAALPFGGMIIGKAAQAASDPSTLRFQQAAHEIRDDHHVAPGYDARVLIRWGDKVLPDAPAFAIGDQTAAAQEKQFGYNNDFVAFMPLPLGSGSSDRGMLCVSHEYTNAELMFPGLTRESRRDKLTQEQVDIEMAAHGHSVVEIRKDAQGWAVVADSPFNRRFSALSSPMTVSGPAAGHPRLRTTADPSGKRVIGTINDCGGGTTPWGTVLIAEENFDMYFSGDTDGPEQSNHKRLGVGGKSAYAWSRFHDRFDAAKEPNEANRFGWIVEIDPYDPKAMPVKRTALGRFKHEAAATVINPDGRVVVYSGDDERFEYLYRFVTKGKYDPTNRKANLTLLDEGTLAVAKFNDDGSLQWMPLVCGQGPLTAANGFHSQADVVIEARRAADLLGATPMDRPEDVEVNPVNGRVYMMLTNNSRRKPEQINAPNPRADNADGHIIEIVPPGSETADGAKKARHDADAAKWNILLIAGDPSKPGGGARYHDKIGEYGAWLSCPDNCTFDNRGRLWISTDQGSAQRKSNIPDGMYACDVDGPGRALTKFFYACPRDAEMCGPAFTPDGKTLFVAVQHPGEHKSSTFDAPSTRWPDFKPDMPPRPSVVAITKADSGVIG